MVAPSVQYPQTKPKMTSAEFLALPETLDRMDLLDGELEMSPAPDIGHQLIAGSLYSLIRQIMKHGMVVMAPADVQLDAHNTVQPDVLWFSPEGNCTRKGRILIGAPELAVEIISASSERRDRVTKFELYERHGVHEYWLADPDAQYMEVWTLTDGKYVRLGGYGDGESFTSPVLGAEIVLGALFASGKE